MMNQIVKNKHIKNILLAVAITFCGYVLLNLTFLFDFVYQSIIRGIVELFIPFDPNMQLYWYPIVMHGSFVVLIGIFSWVIFNSSLKDIYKATYLTVPTAVVLVTVGMFLYAWKILPYVVSSLLCISALYYFYRTKQSWMYYYAVIAVSVALAIFTATGGEI